MKANYLSIIILLCLISFVFSENSEENLIDCGDGILCNKDCLVYDEDKGTFICNCYLGQNEVNCNYKQKSQLKAFLLEFFLCYGAGHFYINNYKLAAPKLVVFVVFYCLFIALRIITKAKEENKLANLIICISAGVVLAGMIAWQIIDLVNFGKNKYKDGNKLPLRNW